MNNGDFALFHTTYPCWVLLEYAFVSSSLVSAIVVAMGVYACVKGVSLLSRLVET